MKQSYEQIPQVAVQAPLNIPHAHWECARILATTYEPQIVLWMLRDVSVSKLTIFMTYG